MNDSPALSCPHCGSHQLVARRDCRRVFINHAGERIPLLTAHFSLHHPIVEAHATIYTCSCSWEGCPADQ